MQKLPLNCEVEYHPAFLDSSESQTIFHKIIEHGIANFITVHGRKMDFGKMTFQDEDLFHSGKMPKEQFGEMAIWFPELLEVKNRLEQMLKRPFQTGVCIYYPTGNVGVDYHSDPSYFGDTTIIPSLSLGQERLFGLKERSTGKEFKLPVKNGDLVVMGKGCQELYDHALLLEPSVTKPRINITFRTFGFLD